MAAHPLLYVRLRLLFTRGDTGSIPVCFTPQMNLVVIERTRALKRFREKLGSPVRNLNTVIVGLTAVGDGTAIKPLDLVVSWAPADLKRAEREARGFAIRALLVLAYDALDHYLADLGGEPSPIDDDKLRSVLRRAPQRGVAHQALNKNALLGLESQLWEGRDDITSSIRNLREFEEKYFGKSEKPSIRKRLSCIYEHCKSLANAQTGPAPRAAYFAGVELMLAWRNVLAHDAYDQLGTDTIDKLRADSDYLRGNHAGIDVERLLTAYTERREPSLKEASTLVSILVRFVNNIDTVLIQQCNAADFFRAAVSWELTRTGRPREILRQWAGCHFDHRLRKALGMAGQHSFLTPDASRKVLTTQVNLMESDLNFLKGQTFDELFDAIQIEDSH